MTPLTDVSAMEEVIRIVEKGVKNSTTLFEPPPVAPSDAAAFALPPSGPASDVEEASAPSPDEEATGTARASEGMEEDGENDLDPSPAPHAVAAGHTEGEAEEEVVDPDAARSVLPLPCSMFEPNSLAASCVDVRPCRTEDNVTL